ncbi:MAG: S1C family serine protease, partial [Planctomycetota bacterium]
GELAARAGRAREAAGPARRAGPGAPTPEPGLLAVFEGAAAGAAPTEAALRRYLSERRSREAKSKAEELFAKLDGASKRTLQSAADDLRVSAADFLLDLFAWHGYERLRVLDEIWKRSRSFPMIPEPVLSSYFRGKATGPEADRGGKVIGRTASELRCELFGAFVEAAVARAPSGEARLPLREVRVRSTYPHLRNPNVYVPDTFSVPVEKSPDGASYLVGLEGWIAPYLEVGTRVEWRKRALGQVAAPKPEREPPAKPAPQPAPEREGALTRPDLIARVAPAVPQVALAEGGWGSGFLVLDGGRPAVITNFHVVARAKTPITVAFIRSEEGKPAGVYVSTVVKPEDAFAHPEADVALLPLGNWKTPEELEEIGIRPLELAPEGVAVRQGEDIFTVGHPVGLGGKPLFLSTKFGDVSGPTRTFPPGDQRFLQMTVSIYPGNSGGPVCNFAGQVVGISTLKQLVSGGALSDDLNFAVDVAYAREVLAAKRVPLLERAARERKEKPLEVKIRESLAEILASGFTTAEEKIGFEVQLAPGAEHERKLELNPARDYALWVVALAEGESESRDVEIAVEGKLGPPTVSLSRPQVGTLVILSRLARDEYGVRLKNPSGVPLKVRAMAFSKERS